jgi:plasmid stabilization system protein ParE
MNLDILWTSEAIETFDAIIFHLQHHWSESVAKKFVQTAEKKLSNISKHPYIFKASALKPSVRKAPISKNCSLFYEVQSNQIVLLFFWDNRQEQGL